MLSQILIAVFQRDLNKLKEEMNAYKDESKIWKVQEGISNSAGNLCLHLLGNLSHFIGATLGGTAYIRNRESEFTLKNIPRLELIVEIEKVSELIRKSLNGMSEDDFNKIYPLKIANADQTTAYFMIHLATHLNYHLGQINYHRRLIGA